MQLKVPKTIQHKAESAEIVGSIDDLLIEILLRLPVKSLIRFKIVSKHWHSLITNPGFLRLPRNPDPTVGVFLTRYWGSLIGYVSFFPKNPRLRELNFTRILHSCNGLLLCCIFRSSNTKKYYVHNPTTKQSSTLPELVDENTINIRGLSLAFEPAKSPHYKVVCVRSSGYSQHQIEIYSSETREWRLSGAPFTTQNSFKNGVFWNGAVHWIRDADVDAHSLYFNIHHCMLEKMPNPSVSNAGYRRQDYYCGESCDHLHYIQTCQSQIQFNVYEMKRDYSEWFVKYRVDLSVVVAAKPGIIQSTPNWNGRHKYNYAFSIFSIVRGKKEDDCFLVLQIPGRVIRYNLVPKTYEKLHEFERAEVKGVLRFPHTIGVQHIESLCCV